MPTLTRKQPLTVVEDYDVAADAKKRISLRSAKTKYFHVKALSNGCFYLEPRVLVSPRAISARSLKMLDKSVANLKKGLASAPFDVRIPNALTARTLNASKAGRGVKRFASKKKLFADLGF